jgi:hypothetical protein
MSALLDLDDVVADNPLARTELAELREEIATAKVEMAEADNIVNLCLTVLNNLTFETTSSYELKRLCRMFLSAHPEVKP